MATVIRCCARSHFTGRQKCCDNCNCEERREAARVYQKQYRKDQKAKAAGLGKLSAVPDIIEPRKPQKPITVKTQYPPGPIGTNALAEIAKIDGANERNPLLVALIMRLAAEIDQGEAPQLSAAANTIKRLMDDLRAQSRPAAGESSAAGPTPQDRFWQDWQQAGS